MARRVYYRKYKLKYKSTYFKLLEESLDRKIKKWEITEEEKDKEMYENKQKNDIYKRWNYNFSALRHVLPHKMKWAETLHFNKY